MPAVIFMAVVISLLCLPVKNAQSATPGTVEGILWNDLDKNGIRPVEGEPSLANWTVHLHKADGTLVSTTQTTGTGAYSFTSLDPGNYYIVVDTKPGWAITQRHTPGSTELTRSDIYEVTYPFPDPAHAGRTNPGDPRTTDAQLVDAGNGARFNGGYYQPTFNVSTNDAKISWGFMRDIVGVDIREHDAYCAGAIPCALNYTFTDNYLADNLDALKIEIDPEWTPGDDIDAIVGIIDADGQWGTVATQYLRDNGFVAAYNIVPGMNEWDGDIVFCIDGYPHADAGADSIVMEGSTHMLDGTGSSQVGIHSYSWLQIGVPVIALSDPQGLTTTFVAPPVAQDLTATFVMAMETHNLMCNPYPAISDPVVITIQDNGITLYPANVTSFFSHNGHPVGIRVNSGGALVSLAPAAFDPLSATAGVPDHIPYELLEFAIKLNPDSAQANVTFFFPHAQPDRARWYKYTSEGKWVLAGKNASWSADGKALTIDLVDGGPGDEGGVDGLIRDPGGLGYFDVKPAPPAPPYEPLTSRGDDSGSSSGCFINILNR
jgi:rhodanese-related sulfurtransferase